MDDEVESTDLGETELLLVDTCRIDLLPDSEQARAQVDQLSFRPLATTFNSLSVACFASSINSRLILAEVDESRS